MSGILLSEQVKSEKTGTYLDRDYVINVQNEIESLYIDVHVSKGVWATCMIYDPNNYLRGQLLLTGDARSILIHKQAHKSNPYTVPGEIYEGEWRINVSFLCNENIEAGGIWGECAVYANELVPGTVKLDKWNWTDEKKSSFQLTLYQSEEVYQHEKRWYKGDFHTHTTFTDGEMSREENVGMAKKQQLDFFVATDHNIVPTSWYDKTDMLVIPGTEVTSPLGHFNIINPNTSPFAKCKVSDMYEEKGTNKIINQNYGDALVSINHPFLKGCPWIYEETVIEHIDTLEIINDPTYPDNRVATEKALIAWNVLLNDGHQITGIGGSDSHLRPTDTYEGSTEPSLMGDPGTYVYCAQLSAKQLMDSVRKGNVIVSRGGFIHFTDGHCLPGEESVLFKGILSVEVETEDAIYIEWIVDGEIKKRAYTNVHTYPFHFSETEYHWIRVDIRNTDGTLYGFSNPIYFGKKEPKIHKWKEVLEKMPK